MTSWTRVGVAFPSKGGEGFDLTPFAVPVVQDGAIRLVVRPAREEQREQRPPQQQRRQSYGS